MCHEDNGCNLKCSDSSKWVVWCKSQSTDGVKETDAQDRWTEAALIFSNLTLYLNVNKDKAFSQFQTRCKYIIYCSSKLCIEWCLENVIILL